MLILSYYIIRGKEHGSFFIKAPVSISVWHNISLQKEGV